MADYNKLFEEFQQDPIAFSKDPEKFKAFQDGLKALMSGKVPEGSGYKSVEELASAYANVQEFANSTPQGKQAIQDMIRNSQTERFVKRNKPFFDAMLGGADLVTSLSQIRQSNKAIRELRKPELPSPNVLDPALNNAISQAQQGNMDVLRQLEPAKQEIAQQRLMDMQTARSTSGGQAGAYGAQATAAGLRANRAAAGLVPMADTIRARQQARLDNLIGMRQDVRQNEFQNRLGIANINMQQYNQDANAAAALGVAGRQNLRSTLGQLPELLSRGVGNLMPVYDEYGAGLEQNLASRISNSNNIQASSDRFRASQPQVSAFPAYQPVAPGMINSARQQRLQGLNEYTSNQYARLIPGYHRPLPNY